MSSNVWQSNDTESSFRFGEYSIILRSSMKIFWIFKGENPVSIGFLMGNSLKECQIECIELVFLSDTFKKGFVK